MKNRPLETSKQSWRRTTRTRCCGEQIAAGFPLPTPPSIHARQHQRSRRNAFSLIELMVVVAITALLAGLLLPSLASMRNDAHRLMSASNLRQIGMGMFMYESDFDALPYTCWLDLGVGNWRPDQLMMARTAGQEPKWDGLGLLFEWNYVNAERVYYAPSHTGNHPFERYADLWRFPDDMVPIFTNYHYAGDVDWSDGSEVRKLEDGERLMLATDGLRTRADLNHEDGLNALHGDGSVRWKIHVEEIQDTLPIESLNTNFVEGDEYLELWDQIEVLK